VNGGIVADIATALDNRLCFSYKSNRISLVEGRFLDAILKVERARRARARSRKPFAGGSGVNRRRNMTPDNISANR
jgi:hypothetical protein